MDGYVFRDLKNLYYALVAPNLWQQHFTMFEVNEIKGKASSLLSCLIGYLNKMQR